MIINKLFIFIYTIIPPTINPFLIPFSSKLLKVSGLESYRYNSTDGAIFALRVGVFFFVFWTPGYQLVAKIA